MLANLDGGWVDWKLTRVTGNTKLYQIIRSQKERGN